MPSRKIIPLAIALLLAVPATAGAQAALGAGGNDAPVEITADNLEVRQQEQLAIFSGNVNAVQGEMTLRADQLRVFYRDERDDGGKDKKKGKGKAARNEGGQQSIRQIEADGNVVVDSSGQIAEGDRGVYDPQANTVVLDGNVVLTQADNVIRGGRLEFDLGTGVAVLRPAAGGQRVRALFQPERGAGGAQAKQEN